MNEKIIDVRNVSKSFNIGNTKLPVLTNINLSVEKGDFLSIMGPSGSGKSTLLYLMGGLDRVTEGQVFINNKLIEDMGDEKQSEMRRKEIGFVFQFYNLIPNLSVEENILLPALLDGKNSKELSKRLNKILDIVGLTDRRKHKPRELSGGQQQRTAIARALITNPDIIFADEPIGNLDSKNGLEILKLLREINRNENKTIIMVTHSEESAKYGKRIIRLSDGQIFSDVSNR